ncbi:MAG: rhomboid family intramembrane serine protease [Planctomycetota bacterium]|nr:MAG: rhomboid family intramembrane serine protease [Planctomycetota bacterium]
MLVVPIRTESEIHRTPRANFALIGINILSFAILGGRPASHALASLKARYLLFHSNAPAFHAFFTYQFLHADIWHLLGNMLFLWVFGNSVNAKMRDFPYLCFYLAGGVFAAWGYALVTPNPTSLLGASGAIASVTTAYLVLYPRSRVTVLIWMFFIYFFQVRAMLIIVLKIIVWDNMIAPAIGGADAIAQSAHLFGYLFGFVGSLGMLLVRALPRDQFDLLALWKRWHQRRALTTMMADPRASAAAQYGSVARVEMPDAHEQAKEERRLDRVSELRAQITEAIERGDVEEACRLYETLLDVDERQCLSERDQLRLARAFYAAGRFPQAAAAFERYVDVYRHSPEASNVRLLLGIIYARDLHRYEAADRHLSRCLETLRDETRRHQCAAWLRNVRTLLGKPLPEA